MSISPVSAMSVTDDPSSALGVAESSKSSTQTQIGNWALKDEIKLSKEAVSLIAFGGTAPATPSK